MTNPNNAVGTNGAFNGRTSVNAFNDIMAAYSKGIVSGWACAPSTGMTVTLGGNGTDRDVAIAEDNAGNKTSINNISGSPISVTIPAAPSTNNRIDLIVAYADNPPTGDGTSTDNPGTVGLIVVSGTAAGTPTAPNDTAIRTAITSDGATGASAYYVILAQILVGQGVTTIGSGVITAGTAAQAITPLGSDVVTSSSIASGAVATGKLAANAVTDAKINDAAVKASKIDWDSLGSKSVSESSQVVVTNSVTLLSSLSLGAGKWLLIATADFNTNNTSTGDCYLGFNNSTTVTQIGNRYYFDKTTGTYNSTTTITETVTLTATTSNITFVAYKSSGTMNVNRRHFAAIRIG